MHRGSHTIIRPVTGCSAEGHIQHDAKYIYDLLVAKPCALFNSGYLRLCYTGRRKHVVTINVHISKRRYWEHYDTLHHISDTFTPWTSSTSRLYSHTQAIGFHVKLQLYCVIPIRAWNMEENCVTLMNFNWSTTLNKLLAGLTANSVASSCGGWAKCRTTRSLPREPLAAPWLQSSRGVHDCRFSSLSINATFCPPTLPTRPSPPVDHAIGRFYHARLVQHLYALT